MQVMVKKEKAGIENKALPEERKKKFIVRVDWERAEKVFGLILEALDKKAFPFDQPEAQPPQKGNLPRNLVAGSVQHGAFLFCLCFYMRGGIKSDVVAKALTKLYEKNPNLFIPEKWNELVAEDIAQLLKSVNLGFNSRQIGNFWVVNFQRLAEKWEGNPANLFKNVSSYDKLCERIANDGNGKGFRGFQKKMASMLYYFLAEAGLVEEFNFPIPVDFHVCRMVLANEIVKIENRENGENLYQPEVLDAIRDLSVSYCREKGISTLKLCDGLWGYSRAICNLHPGNQSSIGERRGRGTLVLKIAGGWSEAQENSFYNSCERCLLAKTCIGCVPSAPYYVRGELIIRSNRDEPPQQFLKFS